MTDSNLIWKYLTREYQDIHPAIYQYVTSDSRSGEQVLLKIMLGVKIVFCPAISEIYVKSIVKQFLDAKKMQYHKGKIIVKSIY